MTRVDFYHNAEDRVETAARIVRKAHRQGVRLMIFAPDSGIASVLDQLLWSHPPGSFLPHCRSDNPLAPETPVVIAETLQADEAPIHDALLINLASGIPPGFSRFERVIEIIPTEETGRQDGRARFRHYRDRGYEIGAFDLAKGSS